jgi:hypothetical protein
LTGIGVCRSANSCQSATTDIKLAHADQLFVRENTGEWQTSNPDEPVVSTAMVIEFKTVDSTGKNKEGKPYRSKNAIDLRHDFVASPTPGFQVLKVKVVPPSCKLLYTTDDSDPANNGDPYREPGIEASEGTSVRLYAELDSVSREATITVPTQKVDEDGDAVTIDAEKAAIVNGRAFKL